MLLLATETTTGAIKRTQLGRRVGRKTAARARSAPEPWFDRPTEHPDSSPTALRQPDRCPTVVSRQSLDRVSTEEGPFSTGTMREPCQALSTCQSTDRQIDRSTDRLKISTDRQRATTCVRCNESLELPSYIIGQAEWGYTIMMLGDTV